MSSRRAEHRRLVTAVVAPRAGLKISIIYVGNISFIKKLAASTFKISYVIVYNNDLCVLFTLN